jgi:hypothetical protein
MRRTVRCKRAKTCSSASKSTSAWLLATAQCLIIALRALEDHVAAIAARESCSTRPRIDQTFQCLFSAVHEYSCSTSGPSIVTGAESWHINKSPLGSMARFTSSKGLKCLRSVCRESNKSGNREALADKFGLRPRCGRARNDWRLFVL